MSFHEELLEVLIRIAEGIESLHGEKTKSKTGSWKNDSATEKQKGFMTKYSIPFNPDISKGKASEKIDRYLEAKKKGA